MKLISVLLFVLIASQSVAQKRMTPELLWELKRVGGVEVSPDNKTILFGITTYEINKNKGNRNLYTIPVDGGEPKQVTDMEGSEFNAVWHPSGERIGFLSAKSGTVQIYELTVKDGTIKQMTDIEGGITGFKYAPDGKKILYTANVKLDKTVNEKYKDLQQANVRIFDDLMYRHWDNWHDYSYSHIFYTEITGNEYPEGKDIMEDERFDSPLNPFGGLEQINWGPKGQTIYYTCKKLQGLKYAVSTNSEIYRYDLREGTTKNLTHGMMGYDMNPRFSNDGKYMAFVSMEEDGFESDKNDIVIMDLKTNEKTNLTADIDLTVSDFVWGGNTNTIYFKAVTNATYQLFELNLKSKKHRQITEGRHNYSSIAYAGGHLIGTRQSMIQPNEIFKLNIKKGGQEQLTFANKDIFENLETVKIEKRMIKTTDGKDMLTWVILPPDFDESKKYPTLLYCQGGPQSAVSQFFSFRWNFHLMAAQGYVIVAPNRRGLPGFGQKWNDDISGDWGGQPMEDYLSAIDEMAKEPYVDNDNLGCIGASYGGYSVYYLAGIHEGRFKTFISHCGLFNLESWYGTTEELFFANKDIGGPYWGKDRAESYDKFSPHNLADNWDTPMLIFHGQRDYRVPVTQGFEAFQVLQIKGIPSKFVYFPDEGHWVLNPQNGLVWHREFFSWLDKWLKDQEN